MNWRQIRNDLWDAAFVFVATGAFLCLLVTSALHSVRWTLGCGSVILVCAIHQAVWGRR